MNYTCSYEVTPELQRDSIRQFYFTVYLGRKWMGLALFIIATVVAFMMEPDPTVEAFSYGLLGVTSVLIILWLKAYYVLQKHGKDNLSMVDNNVMTLHIDDIGFRFISDIGEKTIKWDKVTKVKESKDFIFLLRGKTPILNALKRGLDPEALAILRRAANAEQGSVDNSEQQKQPAVSDF